MERTCCNIFHEFIDYPFWVRPRRDAVIQGSAGWIRHSSLHCYHSDKGKNEKITNVNRLFISILEERRKSVGLYFANALNYLQRKGLPASPCMFNMASPVTRRPGKKKQKPSPRRLSKEVFGSCIDNFEIIHFRLKLLFAEAEIRWKSSRVRIATKKFCSFLF